MAEWICSPSANHRGPRQRVVVLPACQLANASHLAVDSPQARAVALAPDHALVIGGRDLAAPLGQGAVSIKEKLTGSRLPRVLLPLPSEG